MLWGEKTQDLLSKKTIAIVGSGGLGCSIGLALSGIGISEFYVIDFDKIELHNIHRQIAFSKNDVGLDKSIVLSQKMQDRSLSKVSSIIGDFEHFTSLNKVPDIILDATDNLESRKQIDEFAKIHNIPWIYASVEEFRGQVAFFDKSCFDDVFNISKLEPKGIASPMVVQIASFSANLALRYLSDLKIEKDMLHYLSYTNNGEFRMNKFKLTSQ